MECPACHTPNIDGARFCAKCGALLPAAPTEADPLIGAIVGGRFRILDILGEGGMGRVYTAEQQMGTATRKVAVKTLLSEYARDPKVVERFMRECATVVELEHPNTIKFYDYGKTDAGDLYIAMELLTGASLEKTLEAGALAPDRVDRILSQISGSLHEAHDKGIVHRDLKPANIFLTKRAGEEDYVKVLDFGIAKRDDKHTRNEAKLTAQGTVLGTPPYMSPEQFRGQELDPRSDIYSLGVMAYEMLTGRLPFDADTPWAWATQHMTAQPFPFETVPIGSAVPAKMKAAVMHALAKDRNLRPQSVKDFFEEFTMGGGRASAPSGILRPSFPEGVPPTAAGAGGPMPTQAGAPVFVTGGQQGYPSGPGAAGSEHAASNPGIVTGPGMFPSSPGVQVPAPPAAATGSGAGMGRILGIAAGVAAVLGIIGAVVVMKSSGTTTNAGHDKADSGATVTPAAPPDAGKAPEAEPPAESASPDAGAPPHLPTHPYVDPHAEAECRAAEAAANKNEIQLAREHLARCKGPDEAAAQRAFEAAEVRARHHHPPPCPPGHRCPR